MSDKYSDNIQQVAKEMAEAYGNHIVPSGMITAAVVSGKRTSDAVKKALSEWGCNEETITTYLKDEGLIPDSAREEESSNFARFMKGFYGINAPGEKIDLAEQGDRVSVHNPDNPEPQQEDNPFGLLPAIKIPVWPDMPHEAKEKAVSIAAEGAAMMLLSTFMMCGLETHIETTIYNEPTNSYYALSLKKLAQPPQSEGGQNER